MISTLLALVLLAAPCDLKPLEKEEVRLERLILALPDHDPKLPPLYAAWDKAVAAVDSCKAELAQQEATAGVE